MYTHSTCTQCKTPIYLYLEMKANKVIGEFCGYCGTKVAHTRILNDSKK